MPPGRHPEPEFRVATFLPLQVHSQGAITTAASLGDGRCQLALVQGIYGLNEHRRGNRGGGGAAHWLKQPLEQAFVLFQCGGDANLNGINSTLNRFAFKHVGDRACIARRSCWLAAQ